MFLRLHLVTQSGSTYAKTLVNGGEVDVAVETGISADTNTVITSGLTEGQTVITGTTSHRPTTAASTGTSVFSSSLRGGAQVEAEGQLTWWRWNKRLREVNFS